jgi:hypothetical protein
MADLPEDLAASVRMRVGLPIATESVLAGPALRDHWQVHGVRDEIEDQLTVRRAWLRGVTTLRPVLVLSFAVEFIAASDLERRAHSLLEATQGLQVAGETLRLASSTSMPDD